MYAGFSEIVKQSLFNKWVYCFKLKEDRAFNSKQKFLFVRLFFFKHPFQIPAKRVFMDTNPFCYDIIRYFLFAHPENIIQHFLKADSLLRFSTGAA